MRAKFNSFADFKVLVFQEPFIGKWFCFQHVVVIKSKEQQSLGVWTVCLSALSVDCLSALSVVCLSALSYGAALWRTGCRRHAVFVTMTLQ